MAIYHTRLKGSFSNGANALCHPILSASNTKHAHDKLEGLSSPLPALPGFPTSQPPILPPTHHTPRLRSTQEAIFPCKNNKQPLRVNGVHSFVCRLLLHRCASCRHNVSRAPSPGSTLKADHRTLIAALHAHVPRVWALCAMALWGMAWFK